MTPTRASEKPASTGAAMPVVPSISGLLNSARTSSSVSFRRSIAHGLRIRRRSPGSGPPEGLSSVIIVTLQGKRATIRADGCHCIDDGRELHRHPPLRVRTNGG